MPNNKKIIIDFQAEVAKYLAGNTHHSDLFLSDHIQWHLPESLECIIGEAHRTGKADVLDLIQNATKKCYKMHTMQFAFHSFISDKNYVHQHFTLSAETINGKNYQSGYQTLYRIDNEKIAEVWEYFDSGLLLSLVNS